MGKSYKFASFGELGQLMDRIAWDKAKIRGPYNVSDYIKRRTGGGPSGPSFSDYYYEKTHPAPKAMRRFVKAFDCSEEEITKLARAYMLRFRLGEEE